MLDEEAAPHVALAPIPAHRAPVADDAPRIGAKGESLVRAARELPRWDAAAARDVFQVSLEVRSVRR